MSWDAVPGATHYRVGYVNMEVDYHLAKASCTGEWIEAFVYVDVNARNIPVREGRAQYTIRRLSAGARHAFTVLASDNFYSDRENAGGDYSWPVNPRWEFLPGRDSFPQDMSLPAGECSDTTSVGTDISGVTNIEVRVGSAPDEVAVSWDTVPGATHYRVGYVNMEVDYHLAKASCTGEWIEAFVYVDVNARNIPVREGRAQYTIRRLSAGARHAFTVLASDNFYSDRENAGGDYSWPVNPRWEFLPGRDSFPQDMSLPAGECSDGTRRVADAGPDAEALASSTVMLDGTATAGPPGSISSYHWEQVITGSPLVSLSGADTARPAFTLPELGNDQYFVFRLTVTYNDGETSQDEVTITGRPIPGVIVSDVSGNTALVGATAEFYIGLQSRPSSDVVIPVSSSDPSEGVPEQTQVVFTPENWHIDQAVVIRGQNPAVQGGVQEYEIILGSTQSSDLVYDGLDVPNVEMRGIALEIAASEDLDPLIANIPATIRPRVTYTGSSLLSFSLTQSPPGMSIDFSLGTISWTPQESDEGRSFDVTVRVNDGALFAETSFLVTVVQAEPIVTEIQGNMLTVADPSTTLNGMSVTAMPTDAGDPVTLPTLEKVPPESAPERSSSITSMSDVFVVKNSFDNPVELRFPIGQLPDGVSLNDVNFYGYIEVSEESGGSREIWAPLGLDRSLEGTEDSAVYVVSLGGLEGMAFFGYHSTSPAIPFIDVTDAAIGDITCTAEYLNPDDPSDFSLNHNRHTCEYAPDSAVKITVENFGQGCRWPGSTMSSATSAITCTTAAGSAPSVSATTCTPSAGTTTPCATLHDLVIWIIEAQSAFEDLGLGYNPHITVRIENMATTKGNANILGYVNKSREDRQVLHITDNNEKSVVKIQGTVVHEYFHHAQGHVDTQVNGRRLLIDDGGDSYQWLTEGTARWFEDELYDGLDTYLEKEDRGYRIMEAGLNSVRGDRKRSPYQRFSFFKLLSEKCPGFHDQFQNVLNADDDRDPTGIENLTGLLDAANCDFGSHLGADSKRSLAAAIAYYNYATQFKGINGKISLLDSGRNSAESEPDSFVFDKAAEVTLSSFFGSPGHCPDTSPLTIIGRPYYSLGAGGVQPENIPANGAYSVLIPESVCELPPEKVAELTIETFGGDVVVSMTSACTEAGFIELNSIGPAIVSGPCKDKQDKHAWFSTVTGDTSYVFAKVPTPEPGSGVTLVKIPETFVTLVNPSLDTPISVTATIATRGDLVDPVITSHSAGDTVTNRVVTVRGTIPDEARAATEKVIITANGIPTETLLNLDGSFAADVVVSLGRNIIRVRGADAVGARVTNETGISIEGVESSSTRRNALIPSRVVFVLRWDTDRTDIDIYSTDKDGGTLWYRNLREGPGNLDYDDRYGFGPEVVSYGETTDDVYVNGTFDVDVHYYAGRPSTNYTLDVILNEEGAGTRRSHKYRSNTPLTVSNRFQAGLVVQEAPDSMTS